MKIDLREPAFIRDLSLTNEDSVCLHSWKSLLTMGLRLNIPAAEQAPLTALSYPLLYPLDASVHWGAPAQALRAPWLEFHRYVRENMKLGVSREEYLGIEEDSLDFLERIVHHLDNRSPFEAVMREHMRALFSITQEESGTIYSNGDLSDVRGEHLLALVKARDEFLRGPTEANLEAHLSKLRSFCKANQVTTTVIDGLEDELRVNLLWWIGRERNG